MAAVNVEDHIAAIETQIATVSGVQLIDRLDVGAQDNVNAHGGVIVTLSSTVVVSEYRHQNLARVVDTVGVRLSWVLAPGGQKTSRDAAMAKARAIREALTTQSWNRRTRYVRESHTPAKGWYFIDQVYEFDRDASLGG